MGVAGGGEAATVEPMSVAVAVKGVPGGGGGNGSRRAVWWAVENLMPKADRFILIHVMPRITHIPTPLGDRIPVSELDRNVVSLFVHDTRQKFEQVFIPFKKICRNSKVETLILEDENPAAALLRYISEYRIKVLVLGSCSSGCITRKLKRPRVPQIVLRYAPDTTDIYIIHKNENNRRRSESSSFTSEKNSKSRDHEKSSAISSSSVESKAHHNITARPEVIRDGLDDTFETTTEQTEVELLQLELENTVAMYKRACEELVHTKIKVRSISSEYLEEARRVDAAYEREEALRKVVAENNLRHLEALKILDEAKSLLAKEVYERQAAEVNALKESLEKQKIMDDLILSDKRYRRYTREEIETATVLFSKSNVVGEGGYGKVYKCCLDHIPVAVKVLRHDISDKKDEFLKEVEILSQIHHPHVVLLLGACPEIGCLVYEYLENGSLDEYISQQNKRRLPLPWSVRFRIIFQVACGLAFLHNSKPQPIVHRDLKPGNILLDRNFVAKISDVGLAKIIGDVVPDNITEYHNSILAGTLHYMDPEYQRTGTIRPKSDLYAFGVVTLQLLTGQYPHGLLLAVKNALASGSFVEILDKSVPDWPVRETEELAKIALKCSKLRCRDRPDLETEVLPILKRLVVGDEIQKGISDPTNPPSHYICPILQEIMDDPHIAADGFTYEYSAIKAWLEKHDVSPVNKVPFEHFTLTPNHTLHSAIREWKSKVTLTSS